MNIFPPQSIEIYHLLRQGKALTARAVGERMQILPNAVYRAVQPLLDAGVVKAGVDYPVKFSVVDDAEAGRNVAQLLQSEVLGVLGINDRQAEVNAVQGRDLLLQMTNREVEKSVRSVDFLVSGLEVPPDTILAYKRAVDRGVRVRALVQQRDETSVEMYENWQLIGVQVRHAKGYVPVRMFVIDTSVCFYTSYNLEHSREANGQKVISVPLGQLLSVSYESMWSAGVPLGHEKLVQTQAS